MMLTILIALCLIAILVFIADVFNHIDNEDDGGFIILKAILLVFVWLFIFMSYFKIESLREKRTYQPVQETLYRVK